MAEHAVGKYISARKACPPHSPQGPSFSSGAAVANGCLNVDFSGTLIRKPSDLREIALARRIYAKLAGSIASAGVIIVDRIHCQNLSMNFPGPELLGRLLSEHAAALALLRGSGALVRKTWCKRRSCGWRPNVRRRPIRRPGCLPWFAMARFRQGEQSRGGGSTKPWPPQELPLGFKRMKLKASMRRVAANGLSRLALEQREVIVAHVWGGLTFAEIAAIVGSSTSAIHRRYQAGLQTLRNLLGEKCLPTTDSTKHCRKS